MAEKGRAFGLRVVGYDPYLSAAELQKRGAEKADFATLLEEADYVSIHAPLSAETKNMFGSAEFERMKPTAVVINTARGGIIDEKALCQALSQGVIAGAGLDVTNPEPPSADSPLLKMDQVLVTGHLAYFSETSVRELHVKSAEAIVAALRGEWPPFLANPDVTQRLQGRMARERGYHPGGFSECPRGRLTQKPDGAKKAKFPEKKPESAGPRCRRR
jgi:D-3-phosphoglycerate dehydrogenase